MSSQKRKGKSCEIWSSVKRFFNIPEDESHNRSLLKKNQRSPGPSKNNTDRTPVVIDEDEEEGPPPSKLRMLDTMEDQAPEDEFCKVTVVRPPEEKQDKGVYSLVADELRIGSFLLKKRMVTFSHQKLQVMARPIDSRREVELNFESGEIIKVVWALSGSTPAAFFILAPLCASRIQLLLHMKHEGKGNMIDDSQYPFFDPKSQIERRKRVIVVLNKKLTPEDSERIWSCYISPKEDLKAEFAEKLLSMTRSSCQYYETPLPEELKAGIIPRPESPKHAVAEPININVLSDSSNKRSMITRSSARGSPVSSSISVIESIDPSIAVCRYPLEGKGCSTIKSADLLTLDPDALLNDSIIDFCLRYLHGEQIPKKLAEKVFIFNTFFYSTLTKTPGKVLSAVEKKMSPSKRRHNNVKRWTKDVDLFSKDFILIPVCQNCHWFLIIVCYPWLVPVKKGVEFEKSPERNSDELAKSIVNYEDSENESDTMEKSEEANNQSAHSSLRSSTKGSDISAIYVFDSLRGSVTSAQIYTTIRDYFTEEFAAKRKKVCAFDFQTMRGYYPHVPQQANFHDCGIFLLEYAKAFLQNPPPIDRIHRFEAFQQMFDPVMVMQNRREEVTKIILRLHEEQVPGSSFLKNYDEYIQRRQKHVPETNGSSTAETELIVINNGDE